MGVLLLRDVAALDEALAASAWRMAGVAALSIATAAVAPGLLVRALAERNRALVAALAEGNAERAARRSELERIQAVVDSMADGVIFIDAQIILPSSIRRDAQPSVTL